MPIEKLLTMAELKELIPYSSAHVYRLIKQGDFPKPIRLGPNRVAWRTTDIERWIEAREVSHGVPFHSRSCYGDSAGAFQSSGRGAVDLLQ